METEITWPCLSLYDELDDLAIEERFALFSIIVAIGMDRAGLKRALPEIEKLRERIRPARYPEMLAREAPMSLAGLATLALERFDETGDTGGLTVATIARPADISAVRRTLEKDSATH